MNIVVTCDVSGDQVTTATVTSDADSDPSNDTVNRATTADAYDSLLFDDMGRSWVCINTVTGNWSWTDTLTGQTFTGIGLVTFRNNFSVSLYKLTKMVG